MAFRAGVLVLCLLGTGAAYAQDAPFAPSRPGYVEAGAVYEALTGPYANGRGAYVNSLLQQGPRSAWRAEAVFLERFGEPGFLYGLEHLRTFSPRWYGRLHAGTSSGGFFLPRFRVDAQLARKWLPRQQLITFLSAGVYDARDVHRDYAVAAELLYYVTPAWIAQASVRWNVSTPGPVPSRYHYVALMHGRDRHYFVSLRYAFGNEAYQVVDPLVVYADFRSRDVMLTWRQWLAPSWGFNAHLTHYANPHYRRRGLQVGFFRSF